MIFLGQTKAACPGYQPLCILTRTPLPAFSPFRVFFSGVPADVSFRCGAPFEVDRARLTQLGQYTMRICRSLANKPFECEIEDMGFFLAPLNDSAHMDDIVWPLPRPYDWIPWDDVSLACSHWAISLKFSSTDALEKDIEDAIIQDRWVEFTRRYDTPIVRHDLSPLSRPEGVVRRPLILVLTSVSHIVSPLQRESTYENHIEYCRARRKGFEGLQNDHQPLIEVSRIPALLNRLNPASRPWGKEQQVPPKRESKHLTALLSAYLAFSKI